MLSFVVRDNPLLALYALRSNQCRNEEVVNVYSRNFDELFDAINRLNDIDKTAAETLIDALKTKLIIPSAVAVGRATLDSPTNNGSAASMSSSIGTGVSESGHVVGEARKIKEILEEGKNVLVSYNNQVEFQAKQMEEYFNHLGDLLCSMGESIDGMLLETKKARESE